jgi:hypothetical protein
VAFALAGTFAARASGWSTSDEIVQSIYQHATSGTLLVAVKMVTTLLTVCIQTPSTLQPFQTLL